MKDVKGKNVIITGASAGLGRAIAVAFAKAGAKTGLIAREETALRETQNSIEKESSIRPAIAAGDTSDTAALAKAALTLETELGGVDIWINNAMETIFSRVDSISPEEFKRVTEVNYLGYVYGTLEALKRMLPANKGHIIQIGSALAYRSIPLQSAYCASKFAIRGFTDSLRCELLHNRQNIDLTIVHMPALNTPQFSWARTHLPHQPKPVGKIFSPEVGASAVLHAARYPRRAYWVGSSTIAAILGEMFLPGWMDHKMAQMCYEKQWVEDEDIPPRAGNLFAPAVPALHTLQGRFSNQSASSLAWKIIAAFSKIGLHP